MSTTTIVYQDVPGRFRPLAANLTPKTGKHVLEVSQSLDSETGYGRLLLVLRQPDSDVSVVRLLVWHPEVTFVGRHIVILTGKALDMSARTQPQMVTTHVTFSDEVTAPLPSRR